MARSPYIIILIKSTKGLELVASLQHWAKKIEMFVIEDTSIWPSFILLLKNKHKCILHSIAYDNVTDFEICGFYRNTKI